MVQMESASSPSKTLFELMNIEFNDLLPNSSDSQAIRLSDKQDGGNVPLSQILRSDKDSAIFIRNILHDDSYADSLKDSKEYPFAQTRARHSVITFLMGMMIFKLKYGKQEIRDIICQQLDITAKKLTQIWMATSLYHDMAYYSEIIKKDEKEIVYKEIVHFYLLDDDYIISNEDWKRYGNRAYELEQLNNFSEKLPLAFAHNYKQIEAYDKYARKFHRDNGDEEHVDHGILGGVLTFDRLTRKRLNGMAVLDLESIKLVSLTIAQHNIFKSKDDDSDKKYVGDLQYLQRNQGFRIGAEIRTGTETHNYMAPLLLLLSLVDTVECVKKLSKGSNKGGYLETNTVLSAIKANIYENTITLDFSELYAAISRKGNEELLQTFKNHLQNIQELNCWTIWNAKNEKNKYQFSITIAS